MRAIIQRVTRGEVKVDGQLVGAIDSGWVVLLGVLKGDQDSDCVYVADKICGLRAFTDDQGKMNLSVVDVGGKVLAISQFTLGADLSRGRRPSFTHAEEPTLAKSLYEKFCREVESRGVKVATGQFQAHMRVELVNDGPVTFVIDSKEP
jgi:D-tyrosyl-tRNA(Tyr) deacylase